MFRPADLSLARRTSVITDHLRSDLVDSPPLLFDNLLFFLLLNPYEAAEGPPFLIFYAAMSCMYLLVYD